MDRSKLTRRDVYLQVGCSDGDGSRERPYGSIQEVLDLHREDWGQVLLDRGSIGKTSRSLAMACGCFHGISMMSLSKAVSRFQDVTTLSEA